MLKNNKFTWGDAVLIKHDAPQHYRPREFATVCGLDRITSQQEADELFCKIGEWIYLVEYEDGSSIEIPESYLGKYQHDSSSSSSAQSVDTNYANLSSYNLIYWLIQDGKINPKDLFAFSALFWPSFIERDGYLFLKDCFSESEYVRLVEAKDNPEYWINLCTVDGFFSEMPNGEEQSKILAQTLAETWSAKLKREFPDRTIVVECLWNEEYGDCGLTFYQTDKGENAISSITEFKEIANPNIKENKISQFSGGSRPGMPRIRKPRPDEIPN